MANQKPTLEYGRPDPLQRGRIIKCITICAISVVLAIGALAAMALVVTWCWAVFGLRVAKSVPDYVHAAVDITFAAACGSLLLWLAWRNIRRLKQR